MPLEIRRRVVVTKHGGPEVLRVVEDRAPAPGPSELRLRVRATGVAFADVYARRGVYPGAPPPPFTPGFDAVGEVDAVGAGVDRRWIGRRVAVLSERGGNATHLCWPASLAVPVPDGVDDAEAAALVLNYVTAHQMLARVAAVPGGGTILMHALAGGVGTAMMELAALSQIRVIGTAGAQNHALVRAHRGEPIDYRREDFVLRARELAPAGVDAAFDGIGGAHLSRSYATLAPRGTLVSFGFQSAVSGSSALATAPTFLRLALLALRPDRRRVRFYAIARRARRRPRELVADLGSLFALLAEGRLRPLIAARLPLERAGEAHAALEAGGAAGKFVLMPR